MTEPAPRRTLLMPSPEDTAALACHMAPRLAEGDVLLLHGPIGAGKSHFARALIRHLLARAGALEDVPSPTFTLVQCYQAGSLTIWHADLYRLSHPDQVIELGLDEAFETALCLVEWPDRLGDLAPADALHISFAPGPDDDSRYLTLSSENARWDAFLKSIPEPAPTTLAAHD